MRRRDLVKGIVGSAATWPIVAVAQQPLIPVIGFLSFRSANESASSEAAFREGLSEIGYVEGRNVHIAFRWAEGRHDRLSALAADLVDKLLSRSSRQPAEVPRHLQPRLRQKPFRSFSL